MSLFGQQSQQTPGSGGGLFGQQSQQPLGTGGGLFGQSSTSMSTPTQTPMSRPFGLSTTGNQTMPQNTLFGQSQTGNQMNLFGQSQTGNQTLPQNTLFGQSQPGGQMMPQNSLFGQSQPGGQMASQNNLFGQSQSQPGGQMASQNNLFGQSQSQPGGQMAPQNNFFGQSQPGSQMAPQNNLFGQTQIGGQAVPQNSLFGQSQTGGQAIPQNNLFGQSQTGGQTVPQNNLFGQSQTGGQTVPQNSLFGQSQHAGLFQPGVSQTMGGSLFGSNMNLSQPQMAPMGQSLQPNIPPALRPQDDIQGAVMAIKNAWDPNSPDCRFKHYFYNLVHPNEVHYYTRPVNQSPEAWKEAMDNNPDPTCMVPALAIGLDDIRKRVDLQTRTALSHSAKLDEISQKLSLLQQSHQLKTSVKLQQQQQRYADLSHRLLTLSSKVSLVINNGYPIRPEEEAFKARLEQLEKHISKQGQFRGKISDLWAQIRILKDMAVSGSVRSNIWEITDENQLQAITNVLTSQQSGLNLLTDTLKEDEIDLRVLEMEVV